MGGCLRVGKLSHYVTSNPDQLSLAIPPWVGAVSTGDGTTTVREENGEFCVAVAPATRTAGILTMWLKALAVKLSRPSGQSGSYIGLIGFNPRQLKGPKGG